ISDRIHVGIAEAFGFLLNEFAPARHVVRDLAAHRFRQKTITLRAAGELIEAIQGHAGTSQKDGANLILSRKLFYLRRKKANPLDQIILGERTDAPDKSLEVREEPFGIGGDG